MGQWEEGDEKGVGVKYTVDPLGGTVLASRFARKGNKDGRPVGPGVVWSADRLQAWSAADGVKNGQEPLGPSAALQRIEDLGLERATLDTVFGRIERPMGGPMDGLDLESYARTALQLWGAHTTEAKEQLRTARTAWPPQHTVSCLILGNEFAANVTDVLGGSSCRTISELRGELRRLDALTSGWSLRQILYASPKFLEEDLPSGSWRVPPGVKYQYKSAEVVATPLHSSDPCIDMGKWLIYFVNIAMPRLAILHALVGALVDNGCDERTPVAMFRTVPWARAARDARPGSIVVDCGSGNTKYISAAKPTLTPIKTAENTSLKLSEVASLSELREYVEYVLDAIDSADAAHASCEVFIFTTEVRGVYVSSSSTNASRGERRFTPEWAEWTRVVLSETDRLKAFEPMSPVDEASFECDAAKALLVDQGQSTKVTADAAMLSCGGGTFQHGHRSVTKAVAITAMLPGLRTYQLLTTADGDKLAVDVVDITAEYLLNA